MSKLKFLFAFVFTFNLLFNSIYADVGNLVCYYDSSSYLREGPAQITLTELEPALTFCNYIVYGYAAIDRHSYQLIPRLPELDIAQGHYTALTSLKRKYPHLRFLLSVGGDKDLENDESLDHKYLTVLESMENRHTFVESARSALKTYGFDGLDLAWQFPKNRPKAVRGTIGKAWNAFKGIFRGKPSLDEKAEEHKEQFNALVREMSSALRANNMKLSLTVLPNVDANLFIDIYTVMPNVDFVNLATFDFLTPERDPKIADYPAPLYEGFERKPENNINYQVELWLNHTAPSNKINIGIPAFGRAWIMSKESGMTGFPPIPKSLGVAPGGKYTLTPGLLSWPEICEKLSAPKDQIGNEKAIRKVGDPTKRYGTYAYRAADENDEHGLWVGYEEPASAAIKAGYVTARGLGGVAFFDLSLDDFKGTCAGEKFPILRSIKFKL